MLEVTGKRLPTRTVLQLLCQARSQEPALHRRRDKTWARLSEAQRGVLAEPKVLDYVGSRIELEGVHLTATTLLSWLLGEGLPAHAWERYFDEADPDDVGI